MAEERGRVKGAAGAGAGDEFQAATKYVRKSIPARELDWEHKPAHYKVVENAVREVKLPEPLREGGRPIWDTLQNRRTRRTYKHAPLSLAEVSQILWAGNGKTREGRESCLRTAPSAGALYPIEMYLMVNNVSGLEKGIYYYDVPGHSLLLLREGSFAEEAANAALGQNTLVKSGVVVFMTAVIERTRWKYNQRAYRYIYIDAGHICQNLCLASEALGLGQCPIGAFYDDEVNNVLGIDGENETVFYAITIGK
jgi:SagB-type dehydrogenase family enzyme